MRIWIGSILALGLAGLGCNMILGNGDHQLVSDGGNESADAASQAESGSPNGNPDTGGNGIWDGPADADGNGGDSSASGDSGGDGANVCNRPDAGSVCMGDCVPYTTRCATGSKILVETCDVTGHWGASTPCTFVCDAATHQCGGQCAPGTPDRCAVNTVQTCTATGQWMTLTNCMAAPCSGGTCRACALGEKQCNSGKPQTCNSTGAWVDDQATPCPFVCDALTGKCAGECIPGSDKCAAGATSTHCGANGVYGAATTCPNICDTTSGRCGGVCSPAAQRCSGSSTQTCGTNGQWGSGMTCAFGCNTATGACNNCTDDPLSTTCMGSKCAMILNNCGRAVQCPACTGPGQTCGGGGVAGVCGCIPETDRAICMRLGKNCAVVAATDNCGSSRTPNCGMCTAPQTCGGGNIPSPNVCGCTGESDASFCSRLMTGCGPLTGTDNCGSPRTVSNCGSCSANQVCSASRCLLAPGELCATGSQCGSGVCGGRCCQPGVACNCPQPSAQNLLANPGFDSNLSGWTADPGAGGYSWQPNAPPDGFGVLADATSCPFSGSAYLAAPAGAVIQRIWQCVPVSPGASYNFGVRIHTNAGAYAFCGVDLYPGAGCTGTSTLAANNQWINVAWSSDLTANFNTGIYASARVSCYVDSSSSQGAFFADLIYLTPAPGGY